MNHSNIRFFPDPILRKKARLVSVFDSRLKGTVLKLSQVLKQEKYGVGISAPQIGISEAVAFIDLSKRIKGFKPIVLINPKIIEMRNPVIRKEGCMSIPDYTAYIKRFDWIRVSWLDQNKKSYVKECSGIEAICVQHEVDHLNGILFIDRVACLKTDLLPRHFKK